MSKIKYVSLACGTMAVALTAAHFMQGDATARGLAPEATSAPNKAVKVSEVALSDVTLTSALPFLPDAPQHPVAALPAAAPAPDVDEQTPVPALPSEESVPRLSCDYVLHAEAQERAMVRLSLDARCLENERFTLHHNGLMFTGVTNEAGQSEMLVPALSTEPVFIVAFLNGEGAVANTVVPDFSDFDRVVVQWKGESGLQLHAREFDAAYGAPGHVWAGSDTDAEGFLVRLGDEQSADPLMADVYSFPSGQVASAEVMLSVEAEVTRGNCAQDVEAQTLEFLTGGKIRSQDLTLAIPECDAVGDFLVLKNLLNDLKIAGN